MGKTKGEASANGTVAAGSAARQAGISRRMLKHYEEIGLVKSEGPSYAPTFKAEEIETARTVGLLRKLGFSLSDISVYLCKEVSENVDFKYKPSLSKEEFIAELEKLKSSIDALLLKKTLK